MLDRLCDWLSEHQTAVSFFGGLGALVCGTGLQVTWNSFWMVPWIAGAMISIALPVRANKVNALKQGQRAAKKCIHGTLAALAAAYGYPDRHARANVMLLSADGKRRTVHTKTAFNMNGDPDCDLSLSATVGVSGQAFTGRVSYYGDLTIPLQPGAPGWGLQPSELAKVRQDLKSILSAPILDPDDPDGPLLGTLQVDSSLTFDQMGFDDPARRAIAERFADVIALLLKQDGHHG